MDFPGVGAENILYVAKNGGVGFHKCIMDGSAEGILKRLQKAS